MTDRVQAWRDAAPEAIGDGDPADLVAQIASHVELEGNWFLDYGAGVGRVARPMLERGARLVLVDANPDYLAQAPAEAQKMLVKGDLEERLPLCHHAYSSNVFIHFTWRYAPGALAHLATAVPRGGYVFCQLPVYEVAREGLGWIDVTTYSFTQVLGMAEAAGLTWVSAYCNPGAFDYDQVGPYHSMFQVFVK